MVVSSLPPRLAVEIGKSTIKDQRPWKQYKCVLILVKLVWSTTSQTNFVSNSEYELVVSFKLLFTISPHSRTKVRLLTNQIHENSLITVDNPPTTKKQPANQTSSPVQIRRWSSALSFCSNFLLIWWQKSERRLAIRVVDEQSQPYRTEFLLLLRNVFYPSKFGAFYVYFQPVSPAGTAWF